MRSNTLICSICNTPRNDTPYCVPCKRRRCREYKARHRQEISSYNKSYKKEHKDEISDYNRQYNIDNRETIQKRHTPYLKNKRYTDFAYKLALHQRSRIYTIFKKIKANKCDHTMT